MTNPFIERLAKVLCEKHGFYPWDSDFAEEAKRQGDLTPDDYREMIRAILTELREAVTMEMLNAMEDEVPFWHEMMDVYLMRQMFRAALDIAMKSDAP